MVRARGGSVSFRCREVMNDRVEPVREKFVGLYRFLQLKSCILFSLSFFGFETSSLLV